MLGIDHIYLYCNDDNPDELYEKVSVFCRGSYPKITFIHFPFQGEQWKMYVNCLEKNKGASKYFCFLDVDEFITIKNHENINDFISEFDKKPWDSIILNWVYFGNNFYETRPQGNVLENYTKRSKRLSHITKVIVKSNSINLDFIKSKPVPFWHGIGVGTYDVFNYNLNHITPLGNNFKYFYEKWWEIHHKNGENETINHIEKEIMDCAYVSHFFLKSREDAARRILRGTAGNFTGQSIWDKKSTDELDNYLKEYNEVDDFFLKNLWKKFNIPGSDNFYIERSEGINISEGCLCDQSSISEWSQDTTSTLADAARVVNLPANGDHKHHTGLEDNAWWSIDLGSEKTVNEIRIYHRNERNVEIKNFKIESTIDNINWTPLFIGKDYRFGGIDGRPLIIKLDRTPCRKIKLTLMEFGSIHLDRFEVYE
ncbi:discoidin domain-containing protein [Gluconobacter cerinus]|nr:discoidin domain-containing protein [Gluconobacter cerinus]